MPKRRKPQRVPKAAPRAEGPSTSASVAVPKLLEQIELDVREGTFHAAWTLACTLPPLPGAALLRSLLRLFAREVSGALDELALLVPRMPALGELIARLRRADPAQLEAAMSDNAYLLRLLLVNELQRDPSANVDDEACVLLLELVQDERTWKEAQSGQALPDDEHDWVLLRDMLRLYPTTRATGWVYTLKDTTRFIREAREVTGAPGRPGLPASIYAKMMYAALETGDLETGEQLLKQPDWKVVPPLRRFAEAVLLGRAALLHPDAALVHRALEVSAPISGAVNRTELTFTNRMYPRLLAAAAALKWRLPGHEATVRTVLGEIGASPWNLSLIYDYVGDLTYSSNPRYHEDELNVSQSYDYLPAFEEAAVDAHLPGDLRALCALVTEASLSERILNDLDDDDLDDDLTARAEAAFKVAEAFAPDALWLHYRRSVRATQPVTPMLLRSYGIWAAAALRDGEAPDAPDYRFPEGDAGTREQIAELHRVLMDWPQDDPDVQEAGEILRLEAWEKGGWPEQLEAHSLHQEGSEAATWRLGLDPSDPELLFFAGLRAHQAGLTPLARTHYEAVLRAVPPDVFDENPTEMAQILLPTRLNLALLDLDAGDTPAARAHLNVVLALNPDNEKALELTRRITPPAPKAGRRAAVSRKGAVTPDAPALGAAFLQTASARYPKVNPVARKLLGVLALLERPLSASELAEYSAMDTVWVGRHLSALKGAGMLTQEGAVYHLNPAIAAQARLDADHVTTIRLLHASTGQAAMPIFRSHRERMVYNSLLHQFPNQLVFPNMALQSIFAYDRMRLLLDAGDFDYYLKAIADFCVVSTVNYLPLLVLEVDSAYHDLETAQERDARKDRIVTQGGLSLLRVRPHGQPTQEMVHAVVSQGIQDLIRSGQAPALKLLQGTDGESGSVADTSGEANGP